MDFTFCAIDLGITKEEKNLILNEILNVPDELYHPSEFRGCRMLSLYNGGGIVGPRQQGVDTSVGKFIFTEAGDLCPTLQNVCENKIFPFMDTPGRIGVLRTEAGKGLNVHIDSRLTEIGKLQHKFRLVLTGDIGKLFFLDSQGNRVYIPDNYDTYIMDGSHPHSLSPASVEKITVCIGFPWIGNPTKKYEDVIKNAKYIAKISRPDSIEDSWVDPYFKYMTTGKHSG